MLLLPASLAFPNMQQSKLIQLATPITCYLGLQLRHPILKAFSFKAYTEAPAPMLLLSNSINITYSCFTTELKFISVFSQVNSMGDSTAQQLLVLMPSENCSFLDYIVGQETEFLLIYQNFIV
jgi:hypothetical protein